jgi:hypothetical protein
MLMGVHHIFDNEINLNITAKFGGYYLVLLSVVYYSLLDWF